MDALSWEKWWLQPFVVPSIPSFLVNQKFVVPSSHSKFAPGQDLVWTEWSFACWLWCLQMMKNLLQLQWLMSNFNLESPCIVTSVVGQLEHSCDDLWGPFLHGVEVLKAQFLLTWDQQDWIEMADASNYLRVSCEWWRHCCLWCLPFGWCSCLHVRTMEDFVYVGLISCVECSGMLGTSTDWTPSSCCGACVLAAGMVW